MLYEMKPLAQWCRQDLLVGEAREGVYGCMLSPSGKFWGLLD